MRVPRFFCRPEDRSGDRLTLPADESRHARKVLRLGPGDRIAVLDGTGVEYEAVVEAFGPSATPAGKRRGGFCLTARVLATRSRAAEPSLQVILLQGLPKGDKMDLIVQKATELGVSRIVPVQAKRSISRPEPERGPGKAARWQRIAQEAAKQAGRSLAPAVEPPRTLAQALGRLPEGCTVIVPWEGEGRRTLAEAVAALRRDAPAALLIGPEGGLAEDEIEQAEAAGALTVTLGPRILRTETAGFVALACLLYATGNLE
ncbi:MAG TPA: 16S rRNA (uracil(1498)-N(3))-methyltransferase [Firmicutes bacterium]|nr:16S rRNA (uracil(1498)-N(3))-methyltransferase [Bacillota bacterium]